MDATTTKTMAEDESSWREKKLVVWVCKGVRFIAAQWLLIGFAVACVLGRFFPCEFLSLLRSSTATRYYSGRDLLRFRWKMKRRSEAEELERKRYMKEGN